MTRRNHTRVDQRVDSLNHQLGAVESNHRDARRSERQSKDFEPAHRDLATRSQTVAIKSRCWTTNTASLKRTSPIGSLRQAVYPSLGDADPQCRHIISRLLLIRDQLHARSAGNQRMLLSHMVSRYGGSHIKHMSCKLTC